MFSIIDLTTQLVDKSLFGIFNISADNYMTKYQFGTLIAKLLSFSIFKSIEIIDYKKELVEDFYNRDDWGISHSCFENEPFGYSIFQSVDYGKLPIIHQDWCKEMKYPFRAKTQKQFEKKVAEISNISIDDRNTYLGDLKNYLSKYSSVEKWREKLLSIYNQDGDQVWLPTSISPSKDV